MTERDLLIGQRGRRLREGQLRGRRLRGVYGINQQIVAETAQIQSQIDKAKRDPRFSLSDPQPMPQLSAMEELRQQCSKIAADNLPFLPNLRTATSKFSSVHTAPVAARGRARLDDRWPQSQQHPTPEAEDYDMDNAESESLLSVTEQNTQPEPQLYSSSKCAEDNLEGAQAATGLDD